MLHYWETLAMKGKCPKCGSEVSLGWLESICPRCGQPFPSLRALFIILMLASLGVIFLLSAYYMNNDLLDMVAQLIAIAICVAVLLYYLMLNRKRKSPTIVQETLLRKG